jgi:hypothetical protein
VIPGDSSWIGAKILASAAIVASLVVMPAWATQAVSMHLLVTEARSKKKRQLGLFLLRGGDDGLRGKSAK